jgi:hypothetical protein
MKKKAAIFIISGRKNLLYNTLYSFFKNWNSKFNYPVYVHTFGKIYSELEKQLIKKDISPDIFFYEIEPEIPTYIKEKEIFYNRKYNSYVVKNFGKNLFSAKDEGIFLEDKIKLKFKSSKIKPISFSCSARSILPMHDTKKFKFIAQSSTLEPKLDP